jgi:hypothetical protein
MKNECLDAARAVLAEHGIRDLTVSTGGKHLMLRFMSPTRERECRITLPVTSSDWRSAKNTRRDVRRASSRGLSKT